jgi:putative DNA primase/helicase
MDADRVSAMNRRAELVRQLQAMPAAMRERQQWLLWRFEKDPRKDKPLKVPYYASGRKRFGVQGSEQDRAALASFDTVLDRLQRGTMWEGVGFAFLPGDGFIGVDVDGAIDPETGEMSELCRTVVEGNHSYTELSPSGKGVHVILQGKVETFKDNGIGLEVFCGSQYFTCTGRRMESTPADVQPAQDDVLAWMREEVEASRERQAQAAAAARAQPQSELPAVEASGPVPADDAPATAPSTPPAEATAEQPPAPPPAPKAPPAPTRPPSAVPGQAVDDFKRVNDAGMLALHAWVPSLFPGAREKNGGYRLTSKDLGRDLQEDLTIRTDGIVDFGVADMGDPRQGRRTPIDLVMEWGPNKKPREALHWLAAQLGVTLTSLPPRRAPADAPPAADKPRPHLVDGRAPPGEGGGGGQAKGPDAAAPAGAADGDGDGEDGGDAGYAKFKWLRESFALIYGTDTVWDGSAGMIMKISNMAHAHGTAMVKRWKGGQMAWRRSDGGRWTVMPQNVVFDPTMKCDPDTHVNLYSGFPTVAKQGDVGPFLELVDFLTSRAADTPEECDDIKHYLLCWMAYPLQNPGFKLRTAVVMHGDEGAGKNILTDTLVDLYGKYGSTVGQDELEDKFNDYRSGKLILVGDEVSSRAELVHNKNRLKALITSPTVQINPKNLPRREEANHINVWFNSNELQPLALDNSDRRYLVIFTPRAREPEFYRRLGKWRANGGKEHLLAYLLAYDCSAFDPFSPAPLTKAKLDLIDMNRKSPERFWLEWSNGELDLPYRSCTTDQAFRAYRKYADRINDRYPVQKAVFMRMVLRIADTMGKTCLDKPMRVDYGAMGGQASAAESRTTRMFLVKPPPDEGQGQWATECWREFEPELRRYLGHGNGSGAAEGADA